MAEIKAQFSGFLELPALFTYKDGKDCILRCRINPTSITSYYESSIKSEGDNERTIVVVNAHHSFNIDMTLEEFDELIKTIDRGISFEDPS